MNLSTSTNRRATGEAIISPVYSNERAKVVASGEDISVASPPTTADEIKGMKPNLMNFFSQCQHRDKRVPESSV